MADTAAEEPITSAAGPVSKEELNEKTALEAAESKPAKAEPAETVPTKEAKPTETEAAEASPPESTPTEVETAEEQPADLHQVENKTAALKLNDSKPAEDTTVNTATADQKPVEPSYTVQVAAGGAAAAEAETPETKIDKQEEAKVSPLRQLWALSKTIDHSEIWGVTLADPDNHVPSQIIFQKYLNANDGNLDKAKEQLKATLEWRAKTKPLELIKKVFSKDKFDGLGYVTSYTAEDVEGPEAKEVFTWNIYGIVKSMDSTFGDKEEFISWRAVVMELALAELSLSTATKPITADYDPYKIYQVHDYKSISFFRQNANVRAASQETIRIFALVYPELLKEKFFVNVPAVMGWMYALLKLFVAPKTLKKFHPMRSGTTLSAEFGGSKVKDLGERLPTEYGGKGEDLKAQGKQTPLG